MSMERAGDGTTSRFERLSGYLAADTDNLALLADAAIAAFDEGHSDAVAALVDRHAALAPLPSSLVNLLGLCALAEGRDEDAAGIFSSLLAQAPDDAALRFNLAWARSRLGDHQAALDLAGANVADPRSAALTVRSLHHLERLEEALAIGDAWEGRKGDVQLWGTLASAALDAEDTIRAARWAERARTSPDGLAALGMLALAEARNDDARRLFNEAIALRPDSARGLLGLGSTLLSEGKPADAARRFDEAGAVFGDHLGTWIAAGWAWLIAGDIAAAQERFERVLGLDDTFSEAHGGLSVLDAMAGRVEDARHRADVALRLDRQSLGGALARALLLERAGDQAAAGRVREAALNAPIGPNGRSVAQMLALAAARGA